MLTRYKDYKEICNDVENDDNFRPGTEDEALLDLVFDEHGEPRYNPPKMAIAIQHAAVKTDLGKLYLIKKTKQNKPEVENLFLLVKYNGNVSFHLPENVIQNKFEFGHALLLLRHVLNQECLHPPARRLRLRS